MWWLSEVMKEQEDGSICIEVRIARNGLYLTGE